MSNHYNPSNWELTKRLLSYIKPFMNTYIMMNLTAFGREGIYTLVAPLLVMLIVDYILVPVGPQQTNWFLELIKGLTGVNDRLGLLTILSSLLIFFAVLRGIFFVIHRTFRGILSQNILRVMRREFYESLINKSFSYLNQVRTGQIISRVTSDMGAIDLFYSETVRESFRMSLQLLIALFVLFSINSGLALICCIPLPIIFFTIRLYSSRVRPYMAQSKTQLDSLNSILIEGITAQKLIKGFGQEESFVARFEKENLGYVDRTLKTTRLQAIYTPSNTVITAAGVSLVIIFGGLRVLEGTLTLGELILFGTYFTQLVGPVRMYSRLIDYWQDALTSARRVFEVMDIGEDVPEIEHPVELPRLKGDIEFKNVSFSYEGSAEILKNVSLSIKAGEKVAIIGFVGSGKSALTELVPRFYDVSSGQVLVDGYDVRDASLKSLRRQVSIVLQNVYIFSTTIRENITFGRQDATDQEVVKVAKAAQIHDYIVSLPKGWDTLVGERGMTLSGGQRQRIAIARTLLMDPSILILDDSTSNVDAETEVLIRKAIDALLEGRTALVITQRASTCESADKVVVIDEGKVIAVGKHAELLKSSKKYRLLIESQALAIGQEVQG
jgi:ATP-binding cassette subfamily B protein